VGIEGHDSSPVYVIDIDKSLLQNLKTHLQRYKLRSKFKTLEIPPSTLRLFSVWPSNQYSPSSSSFVLTDPRNPHLGSRVLATEPPQSESYPMEIYHIRRTLHGVPEGPKEILEGIALPAESDLDVLSGIDYTKGCYVGQELTSRTYHTGVVRKRLVPLSLYPRTDVEPMSLTYDSAIQLNLPPSGTAMTVQGEKRSPGKFLTGYGNLGWGLCRLDFVGRVLSCEWEGGEVLAKPFLPEWGVDRENAQEAIPMGS
jgi:transferase CAF17, mitochondrial